MSEGWAGPDLQREESQALAETFLETSLSKLLLGRELLPEKAFRVESLEAEPIYMLKGGHSQRGNAILTWLHDSAFELLQRDALVAIQICVHPHKDQRHLAYEIYTFTIKNVATQGVEHRQENDILNNGGDGSMSNTTDLKRTLSQIYDICKGLPTLPMLRYLSMNLFLDPESKRGPDVHWFNTLRRDSLLFPEHKEWSRKTRTVDKLSSGLHIICLNITHMVKNTPMIASDTSMRFDNWSDQAILREQVDWNMLQVQQQHAALSKSIRPARSAKAAAMTQLAHEQSHGSPLGTEQMSDTQLERARKIKEALRTMAQPEQYSHGDTQAASFSLNTFLSGHDSAEADIIEPQTPTRLKWREERLHKDRAEPSVLKKQCKELSKEIGGVTRSGQTILCVCSYSREEGDMIRCTICQAWQHAHCYGYVGKDDPRRTEQHYCYICFVDPKDIQTLGKLMELSLRRRAMYRALHSGVMGKVDFADRLSMSPGIINPILEDIKKSGFVVASSGSHKAGFKATGKPPFVPAPGTAYGSMLNELFDPTHLVEAYYEPNAIPPSAIADQLTFTKAMDMPAAATPSSIKRKATASSPEPAALTPTYVKDAQGRFTRRKSKPHPDDDYENGDDLASGLTTSVLKSGKRLAALPADNKALLGFQSSQLVYGLG